MTDLLKNRMVILAKIESTYNVDSSPVPASNAIKVENLSWAADQLTMIERPTVKASLATEQAIYAGMLRKVSFSCEIKGSGTAGTAPEIGVLLRACAMSETIVALTSVTYKPTSSSLESLTIYIYSDGLLYKVTGCRGNVTFDFSARNKAMAKFEFVGHSVAPIDTAIVSPTYNATVPTALIGIAMTLGAYSPKPKMLSFDLGNALDLTDNITASDGFGDINIGKREVKGSVDPLQTLVATHDWEGALRGNTTSTLAFGGVGATAGNILNVSCPAIYFTNIAPQDRGMLQALGMDFRAKESSGDDEVSFAFT